MPELLLVPEVAAGATEVTLSEWLIAPGTSFAAGDAIAVIETDKAIVEVEAESGATLLKPLVEGGTVVGVGSPMALLGEAADLGGDLDVILAALGAGTAAAPVVPEAEVVEAPPARTFISPIARKLLRDAGVPVDGIAGTGPNGRIVRRDVETAISAHSTDQKRPLDGPEEPIRATRSADSTVEHSRLRRAVAQRLTQSKQEVPHFYLKRSAGLGKLLKLREKVNAESGVKVSVNDFLIRAIAVAHTSVTDANVIWTEEAMVSFEHVDVAVAIASPKGLVTPVLRSVETLSLSAISAQVKAFVAQAGEGRLQQRDLEGGSISISNLGMYGVDEFAAIINPPHAAILAVGAARETAVVRKGKVKAATTVDLVLSVDHRAIDGALAAQWMAALVDALEHPLRLVV